MLLLSKAIFLMMVRRVYLLILMLKQDLHLFVNPLLGLFFEYLLEEIELLIKNLRFNRIFFGLFRGTASV